MTGRESLVIGWALAAGCCAGQQAEPVAVKPEEVPVRGEEVPVAQEEAFEAIDVEEAARRLWPRPGPSAYGPANEVERGALAGLIGRMLADPSATPRSLAAEAKAAGFLIEGWVLGGERVLVAIELGSQRRGGGAYLVRVGSQSRGILQAPHGFFDVGTERIALEMFAAERGWPRALFVNTIHRYVGVDGVKEKRADNPADPCHSAEHLLAVATAAAIAKVPGAEVVQLHGFGDEGNEDVGAFAAIVSGGERTPTEPSRSVAAGLREVLGAPVGLYPEDTDKLGATTNAQGRTIRAYNEEAGAGATFVHVELSAAVRRQLRADAALRGRVAAVLRVTRS